MGFIARPRRIAATRAKSTYLPYFMDARERHVRRQIRCSNGQSHSSLCKILETMHSYLRSLQVEDV